MSKLRTLTPLLIIGLGLGWLMGMSTSSVAQSVISVLLGITASLLAIQTGIKQEKNTPLGDEKLLLSNLLRKKVNSVPLMIVIIGIVLGTAGGILTRTHNLLGIPKTEKREESGVLFNFSKETCESLCILSGDDLIYELETHPDPSVRGILNESKNPATVSSKIHEICPCNEK